MTATTLTIQAADADGFAQSQAVTTTATLNGALASGLTSGCKISIATSSDETGQTCTLVGTLFGVAKTEVVTLGNATTVTSTGYFTTITSATFSAAATGVTIGHDPANGAVSAYIGAKWNVPVYSATIETIKDSGSPTYNVQYCVNNPDAVSTTWHTHIELTSLTGNEVSGHERRVLATRLHSASASGAVTMTILEA